MIEVIKIPRLCLHITNIIYRFYKELKHFLPTYWYIFTYIWYKNYQHLYNEDYISYLDLSAFSLYLINEIDNYSFCINIIYYNMCSNKNL